MKKTHRKPKEKTLFQYRPPEEWAFRNLREHVLYFGAPRKFNDPYDTRTPLSICDLTEEQYKWIQQQEGVTSPSHAGRKSVPKDEFVRRMNNLLKDWQNIWRNESGVVCLSETKHNLLMWSQYADKGRGFCLEFHTRGNKSFSEKVVIPVTYSEHPPKGDALKLWVASTKTAESAKPFLEFLSHKSEYWKHEQEWRAFRTAEGGEEYDARALKAVYIGPEAEKTTRDRIRAIVRNAYPHLVELWRGRLNAKKYEIRFRRWL